MGPPVKGRSGTFTPGAWGNLVAGERQRAANLVAMSVSYATQERTAIVTIQRPGVRNAVDARTALDLAAAFERFAGDDAADVAVLTGAGGTFCAGYDLRSVAAGASLELSDSGPAPMGPSRMVLPKPVVAAVEGYAVAGGLELALFCDLRVAASDAVFGVFCRRFGVPLVDLGTIRLPRLIGHGRAMDLILTGRPVAAPEALQIGLINRLTEPGGALAGALELARSLSALPQAALRNDRLSAIEQWELPFEAAIRNELRHGREAIASGQTRGGAERFAAGAGRHGG
jgi:enoyl-CoA hydratase